ncbi:ACT domain-containing protein [Aerococcus christensenii]|uniref:ACT domain-containing protein n=2 Tax=Aerococcus christensenii TaxID=87541 RepID=A0A2I1K616_9LACT|nr:ACT domain-containing protein [Aerococcus christensenii]
MQAMITVVGKDRVGILAKVSQECANANINIVDVAQTVMSGYFTMSMLVNIDEMKMVFDSFRKELETVLPDMRVAVMHEDIFRSMHRI